MGSTTRLGNRGDLQLRRARVQGVNASEWAGSVFDALAEATGPAWGAVSSGAEYDAKVMSDGPGVAAVGRDFGRYLPGLFTRNFFGRPYVELIGRERLLGVPVRARELDSGIVVALGDDAKGWGSDERRELEQRVLEHLGQRYFFSKQRDGAETVAPDGSALVDST